MEYTVKPAITDTLYSGHLYIMAIFDQFLGGHYQQQVSDENFTKSQDYLPKSPRFPEKSQDLLKSDIYNQI